MEEGQLHYLGGIIDADGSIYVNVNKRDAAQFGYYLRPMIQVTGSTKDHHSTRHDLMRDLAEEMELKSHSQRQKRSDVIHTTIAGVSALELMELIRPYVREKGEVIDIILDAPWPRNRYGMNGQPEEEFRECVKAREQVREMNSASHTKYDRERLLEELD